MVLERILDRSHWIATPFGHNLHALPETLLINGTMFYVVKENPSRKQYSEFP